MELYQLLESEDASRVVLCIDDAANIDSWIHTNEVLDLSDFENDYSLVISQLIMYSVYTYQRTHKPEVKCVYLACDEYQDFKVGNSLNPIDDILSQGAKAKIFMLIATQFIEGRFSKSFQNYFAQGGFKFYFCQTPGDAKELAKNIEFDSENRKELQNILTHLYEGECLFVGPHYVRDDEIVTENPRIVKVHENSLTSCNRGKTVFNLDGMLKKNEDKKEV